ncbi:ABC-type proline/glycine betaine transport system substrate-binding protein [Comamonas odontotermitis]|uniref:ABC-type proline/glycine betaine transport system substrate-binding protein n=1 Tax=Comamonas odontotermitis TaxID=379895 RepID=A0ABR6RCW2_9BURK|nr:ABC-type proline/glycine betaine transport system substrate-binding protein [Comamonas odontotermitis]
MNQHNTRRAALTGILTAMLLSTAAHAQPPDLPGKGIDVLPLLGTVDEEMFQTLIVSRALEKLGYSVKAPKGLENGTEHVVVAQGDATFMANHWIPLHQSFYERNGGAKVFYREGVFSTNAAQGYLIDKATADKYKITDIMQLKDPKIAKLFDTERWQGGPDWLQPRLGLRTCHQQTPQGPGPGRQYHPQAGQLRSPDR